MLTSAFIIMYVNTTITVSSIQSIEQVFHNDHHFETITECADAIEKGLKAEGILQNYERDPKGRFIAYTEPSYLGGFRSIVCVKASLPNNMNAKY